MGKGRARNEEKESKNRRERWEGRCEKQKAGFPAGDVGVFCIKKKKRFK